MSNSNMLVYPDNPFHKMVDKDIERCHEFLQGDKCDVAGKKLFHELISKYDNHLDNLSSNMYNYNYAINFYDLEYLHGESLIHNIETAMYKLIAYKSNRYRNPEKQGASDFSIINTNHAAAVSGVYNVFSFEDAREKVEGMTGLSEAATIETLEKIEQIRAIVELEEPRKTKWQKCKPILSWIADKSVDVGIALLPLLLSI